MSLTSISGILSLENVKSTGAAVVVGSPGCVNKWSPLLMLWSLLKSDNCRAVLLFWCLCCCGWKLATCGSEEYSWDSAFNDWVSCWWVCNRSCSSCLMYSRCDFIILDCCCTLATCWVLMFFCLVFVFEPPSKFSPAFWRGEVIFIIFEPIRHSALRIEFNMDVMPARGWPTKSWCGKCQVDQKQNHKKNQPSNFFVSENHSLKNGQ